MKLIMNEMKGIQWDGKQETLSAIKEVIPSIKIFQDGSNLYICDPESFADNCGGFILLGVSDWVCYLETSLQQIESIFDARGSYTNLVLQPQGAITIMRYDQVAAYFTINLEESDNSICTTCGTALFKHLVGADPIDLGGVQGGGFNSITDEDAEVGKNGLLTLICPPNPDNLIDKDILEFDKDILEFDKDILEFEKSKSSPKETVEARIKDAAKKAEAEWKKFYVEEASIIPEDTAAEIDPESPHLKKVLQAISEVQASIQDMEASVSPTEKEASC